MDPLSALGVASSIYQFVDLGVKVATRLKEYNSAASDVPRSLQHISAQLPLLVSALDRMKSGVEVEKVDLDTRCILKGVVSGCKQQVEKIDKIIGRVMHVPGDSLVTKVQKVFVGLKNDEKVMAIEKNLQTYIQVLILHHLIEGPDTSSGMSEDTLYFEVHVRKASPFYERVQLVQEIETYLYPAATSQLSSPIILALTGEIGAGKTQLAVEFCHQAQAVGQFQTIFWLNASTPETLTRSLQSICDIVRRSKEGLKDGEEKLAFTNKFLTDRWHPWLLVLDNYDPTKFKDVLNLLPSHGSGAILLTCRSESLPFPDHIIRVPKFQTPEEADRLRGELAYAVKNDKIDQVQSLLADGADPDSREYSDSGWPCLHLAVNSGNEAIARLLLAKGASSRIHGPPYSGSGGYVTALYWAAATGNTSMTRLILDHEDAAGLTPRAPGNNAVLNYAAEKGREETVRMLLEHGSVHVGRNSWNDTTPLGLAAHNGHIAVVKLLLDAGANPEAESDGATPLTIAAGENHLDIVKLLHEKGNANVNAGDFKSDRRYPPLWYAAKRHTFREAAQDDLVKYLLESGAEPDRTDGKATTPLQEASSTDHTNTISMLLEYGANPYLSIYGNNDNSPICLAAQWGQEKVVNLLLQHQKTQLAAAADNPAFRDRQHEKALINATIKGHRSIVLALLDHGVNINCTGYLGKTPLLFAIEKDQTATARLLLRRGANFNQADDNGRSPLFLAARWCSDLVVKELLRAGASTDVRNLDGETPLCLAAVRGDEKVVRALLEEGRADRDATNRFGDTPLDLALEKGHKTVVEMLEGKA